MQFLGTMLGTGAGDRLRARPARHRAGAGARAAALGRSAGGRRARRARAAPGLRRAAARGARPAQAALGRARRRRRAGARAAHARRGAARRRRRAGRGRRRGAGLPQARRARAFAGRAGAALRDRCRRRPGALDRPVAAAGAAGRVAAGHPADAHRAARGVGQGLGLHVGHARRRRRLELVHRGDRARGRDQAARRQPVRLPGACAAVGAGALPQAQRGWHTRPRWGAWPRAWPGPWAGAASC